MPRSIHLLAAATVAASLFLALLPDAALSASKAKSKAFNPQPDPPGKGTMKGGKSILGPNTKGSWKRIHEVDKSSKIPNSLKSCWPVKWKRIHEVDKRSKSKGGSKSVPAVQKKPK